MRHHFLISLLLLCAAHSVAQAQQASERYASHSVLSTGKWVKIQVTDPGIYQLTATRLRAMGFADPDKVKLYGLNLEVLPETSIEDIADDLQELPLLRADGKLLFYGRGQTKWSLSVTNSTSCLFTHTNNPYSQHTTYFLTEATDSLPAELPLYSYTVDEGAARQTFFPDHALIEKDAYSFLRSGRTFYDDYDYQNGNKQTYTLALPSVADGTQARFVVQFCAAGSTTSILDISVNDSAIGKLAFGSLSDYEYGRQSSRNIVLSQPPATNTISLTHTRDSGVSGHLDFIRASYMRQLDMTGASQLLFRPAASGQTVFQIAGATDESVVLRINDAAAWEQVAGTFDAATSTLSVPFEPTGSASAYRSTELVALNPSATFPEPTVLGIVTNQDLHALDSLNLVIVVPASGKLLTQAQRLADLHTEVDSLRCAVVTADQVYNEFSSGSPDATALRRLMKMLWDRRGGSSSLGSLNLLLFGDGVWDNRMVTSGTRNLSADDYLLCYESDNSLSHTNSYVMEDYYGLVDDNGKSTVTNEYPRVGVGRIPVTTALQARQVVDKLETYIRNEQTGSWKNVICMMADDGNNNIHMEDADSVISNTAGLFPNYHFERIYWDTFERESGSTGNGYPDAEDAIDKQMRDGALIMNYTGHGAAYMMSHEKVLQLADFSEWNSPRLPLWLTAACDVTPFDMEEENIGETALLNSDGAAMGIVSTARTVYSGPNRIFNVNFMSHVLATDAQGRRLTLGEALAWAKRDCIDAGSSAINKAHFVLLGDPAIHLQTPTYGIEVDQINHLSAADASGDTLTVAAGSLVTVTGHVVDEDGQTATGYQGRVEPVIYDSEELVVCHNNPLNETNGNTSTTPYQFRDRIRTLYRCADTVTDGQFRFSFPIPLDNNYSGQPGLISLYACDDAHLREAQGRFTRFRVDGTSDTLSTDTAGPVITFYLNTPAFQPGDVENETPLLYATFSDADGLNMTGSGVGHDLTLVIDNEEALTYSLNSYFTPTTGDYRSGSVTFSIPALADGAHTLTLRAFDILNNASQVSAPFSVRTGQRPDISGLSVDNSADGQTTFVITNDRPGSTLSVTVHVYDIAGRHVWEHRETGSESSSAYRVTWNHASTDSYQPTGVYIVKASINTSNGPKATEAVKFVILNK